MEESRNPDIYTREFVELVQRGNAYVRGKSEALGRFRDVLAEECRVAWGGWGVGEVDRILGGGIGAGGREGAGGERGGGGNADGGVGIGERGERERAEMERERERVRLNGRGVM